MRFEWDEEKNKRNLQKHGVRFETAMLVFDDPFSLTDRDDSTDAEERWSTLGHVGSGVILFVVHTWFERDREEIVRIISASRVEPREGKIYEEAYQGTKARNRRPRHKRGRGYRFL